MARPSTRTPRSLRMCRASRAVAHTFSMSLRIRPMGTLASIGCGPGEGFTTQKSVFLGIVQLRGAGNRFRCFFTVESLLELSPAPRIRVVHPDDQEVRRVQRPGDLLLVDLLDRDPFDDDRAMDAVHGDDLPLFPAEAAPHDAHRVAFPDRQRPPAARLRPVADLPPSMGRCRT